MATFLKNLSSYNINEIPDASAYRFGIIVAEWNHDITGKLLEGAIKTLIINKVKEENIFTHTVPGTFELTLGAQLIAENINVDAIIALGCVIQGETPHFNFICQGVTQGLTDLNIKYNIPVIFGVLTTNSLKQAQERAGGKHGNKGDEAAITAIKMIHLQQNIEKQRDGILK
jgi:6,7-dimethyl-8-ribityllumazine synthase